MTISKLVLILFWIDFALTIVGQNANSFLLIFIGHSTLSVLLALWYYSSKKFVVNSTERLLLLGLILGSVSDAFILAADNSFGEFMQITLTLFENLTFIYFFRKEGVKIHTDNRYDLFLISILALIIFVVFGNIVLPIIPNFMIFNTMIYAIVLFTLFIHGFLRNTNRLSYILVIIGCSLVLSKDILYSLHFFYFNGKFPNLYLYQFPLNIVAYFFIVAGLIYRDSKKNE